MTQINKEENVNWYIVLEATEDVKPQMGMVYEEMYVLFTEMLKLVIFSHIQHIDITIPPRML